MSEDKKKVIGLFVLSPKIIEKITGRYLELALHEAQLNEMDGFKDYYGITTKQSRNIIQFFESFILIIDKNKLGFYLRKLPRKLYSIRVDFFETFPPSFIKQNLNLRSFYGNYFPPGSKEFPKFTKLRRLVCQFETIRKPEIDYVNSLCDLRVLMITQRKRDMRIQRCENLSINGDKIHRLLYVDMDYSSGMNNGLFVFPISKLKNLKFLMLGSIIIEEQTTLDILKLRLLNEMSFICCKLGKRSHHLFEHPTCKILGFIFATPENGAFEIFSKVNFPESSALVELSVSRIPLGGANFPGKFFEDLLIKAKNLTYLNLFGCGVDEKFVEIVKKRKNCEGLETLDIDVSDNEYFGEKIKGLNDSIGKSCKVEFINVPTSIGVGVKKKAGSSSGSPGLGVDMMYGMGPPSGIMMGGGSSGFPIGPPPGIMGQRNFGGGMMPNFGGGRGLPNFGGGRGIPNFGRGMMPNFGRGMMPNFGRGMMPNFGGGRGIPNFGGGMPTFAGFGRGRGGLPIVHDPPTGVLGEGIMRKVVEEEEEEEEDDGTGFSGAPSSFPPVGFTDSLFNEDDNQGDPTELSWENFNKSNENRYEDEDEDDY